MRAWRIGVVVTAAVLLGGLPAAAVPPLTHARLNEASPAPGALLPQAPAAVTLSFNRDIAPPASVAVTSPSGRRIGAGEPVVQGRVVTAPVAPREQGTYTVGFRAVSIDGHPITGRFTFSVGHRGPAYTPRTRSTHDRAAWAVPVAVGGGAAVLVAGVVVALRRRRGGTA